MWIWCYTLLGFATAASLNNDAFEFGDSFREFFHTNKYSGAQVGVNVDGKLAFLHGYGHTHLHEDIHAARQIPVSEVSKAFTAIAVLKLAETGQLDLNSKVFGQDGILNYIEPISPDTVDPRIYDITVDHLLRHNGGWDHSRDNKFDPILSIALLERGYKVQVESFEKQVPRSANTDIILSYLMSESLDYIPGTRSVVSNIGYVILGRIISNVTSTPYDLYVKRHILEPCGLMHTRTSGLRVYKNEHGKKDPDFSGFGDVLPNLIEPALGWESNSADLMRLFVCLDGSGDFQILNKSSIRSMLARPPGVPIERKDFWIGAGFHVNGHGSIWINGEYNTDDVVFFHRGPFITESREELENTHRGQARAWVALLQGQSGIPVRHVIRDIATSQAVTWPADVDHFMNDVTDIVTNARGITRMVRFKVNEHHLTAYINAAKQLRYDIVWLNGLLYHNQTWFTVITEKVNRPVYNELLVEHGFSEKQLYKRKWDQEKLGYNITYFQEYQSKSRNEMRTFIAVFRRHAYNNHTKIKYGLEHFTQPYDKLLELFVEEGYYPTSQSLMYDGYDGLVSFVLEKDLDSKTKKDFKSYDDLTLGKLSKAVEANLIKQRKLVYLDASEYFNRPKFSAIFVKDSHRTMVFNPRVTEAEIRTMISREEAHGFLPKIITGYTDKGQQRYAFYMEN